MFIPDTNPDIRAKKTVWERLSLGLSAIVAGIALLVYAGWFFDNDYLKSVFPGFISMNPTTALCFLFLAASVWLMKTESLIAYLCARVLIKVVGIIGLIRVINYFTPFDFWIDSWIFHEKLGTNRMAPNTALAFTQIAGSHLLLHFKNAQAKALSRIFLVTALCLAVVAVIGYTFGVRSFYNIPSFLPMAVNTAVCFVLIIIALLCLNPPEDLVLLLSSQNAGGILARRLLPAAILVPYLLGYLCLASEKAGWYGEEFSLAWMVTANMLIFFLLISFTVKIVERSDMALKKMNDELEIRVEERTSELKQAQDRLVKQERLRALGEMASGIAHDFNNALSPVLGYSELMLDSNKPLDDSQRQFLKTINTSAKDAANIVSRLSQFGRSRKNDEPFKVIDLNRLIEETITLTQPKWKTQALTKGIEVRIKKDLKEIPQVLGNEQQLREVLTNLIFNAVDAMNQNGCITLRTSASSEKVTVEITDTGTGMSDEVRRKCLEPFFTTKGEHGTGLGLAMVYGIIQQHQGTMEIQSQVGKGTTFLIQFPEAKSASAAQGAAQAAWVRPLTILYVEDNPTVQEVMLGYLKQDGHSVDAFRNGAEGLEKFHQNKNKYDLVLTDATMPQMSGEQLAAEVRRFMPHQRIILLSGTSIFLTAHKVQNIDFVLNKPITLDQLREALAQLFERRTGV